ncbi:MAG TPA: class I SAM-dependent methyltransferase [Anaerolineales bacterium]|nr:class I SAM-dependent methyltransferase [Anaerolineales bacterium]
MKPGLRRWAIDIGCGTGRAFSPLAENGYQIIGIDPIFEAVRAGHERAKQEHLPAWPLLATADHLFSPGSSLPGPHIVSILACCRSVSQINTQIGPDLVLAHAWGDLVLPGSILWPPSWMLTRKSK